MPGGPWIWLWSLSSHVCLLHISFHLCNCNVCHIDKEGLLIFAISLLVLSILIKPPSALSVKLFCGLLFLHQPTSLSYFFPVQTRFPAACYVPVLAARREGLRLLNSNSSPGLGKRVIWMSSCYSDPQQPEWDKGLVL